MKLQPIPFAKLPKYAAALTAAGLITGCGYVTEIIAPQPDGTIADIHDDNGIAAGTELPAKTEETAVTEETTAPEMTATDGIVIDKLDKSTVTPGVAPCPTEDDYLVTEGDVVYDPEVELAGDVDFDPVYEEVDEDCLQAASEEELLAESLRRERELVSLFEDAYRQQGAEVLYMGAEEIHEGGAVSALQTAEPQTILCFFDGVGEMEDVSDELFSEYRGTAPIRVSTNDWCSVSEFSTEDGTLVRIARIDLRQILDLTAEDAASIVQELLR